MEMRGYSPVRSIDLPDKVLLSNVPFSRSPPTDLPMNIPTPCYPPTLLGISFLLPTQCFLGIDELYGDIEKGMPTQ